MLADLIRRLTAPPSPEPLPEEDARLALAALMVRLARSDGAYTADEQARITALLSAFHDLGPVAAEALRAEAERAEASAPDTVRFTRLIKAAVPYEEREAVIEAIWQVALADGIAADERGFLRLVANLCGVSDRDSGLARQRAERAGRCPVRRDQKPRLLERVTPSRKPN
jgi:uncharacterized tellurite resistance protein B-like protein